GAREALAAQAEHGAPLGAGRDLHAHVAVEHRHVDLGAQRGLADGDRDVDGEHAAVVAPVHGVWPHPHDDVQVAGRPAAPPRRPLARRGVGGAARRARRDAHAVAPLAVDQAGALARLARRARHLTGAAAAQALAPAGEEARFLADDALAVAAGAG